MVRICARQCPAGGGVELQKPASLELDRLFQVVLQSVQPSLGERLWLPSRSPTSTPEVKSRKQQEIQTSYLFFSSLPSKAKGLDDGECNLMESAQHWGV